MDKVALITGASGGLGQALAEKLQQDGWQLVLVSRDGQRLSDVYGAQHTQITQDCSTPEGVQQLFAHIEQQSIKVNALAHCVGNIRLGAMHRMAHEDFIACMQANLFSAYYTLAGFIQHNKQHQQAASAVLVSSAAARIGTPNHEAIAAAKGGLEAMLRGAAATYASANIRINAVAPGIMQTPASASLISSDLTRDIASKQYPIPGIGDPKQVADVMAWLLSAQAEKVTGQVWSIDGGFSAIRPIVK